ncbi:hypothetical protein C8A01DRAFT_19050 [Parachaetomium inaequale]|uniref:Uncharacterized protein n=1 Tax=Parachaetomium inaequale TaxID=2588326 RepID=A0AAN6PC61_9PEZI|nr:hypothetical protein C8A01DRAFT_19050 [Parachaetomium inaequale]
MPYSIIVIASFLTTIKSTWDMVRQKRPAKTLKTETRSTLVILLRAHVNELLLEGEFDYLFERLMRANAHNDVAAVRKIRADLQAILRLRRADPAAGRTTELVN